MTDLYQITIPMPFELLTDEVVIQLLKTAIEIMREGYDVIIKCKNENIITFRATIDKNSLL